jgi:hypothetical protein
MTRIFLVIGLLAVSACAPQYDAPPPSGYPVHSDPLCYYGEPYEPGGPLSVICA